MAPADLSPRGQSSGNAARWLARLAWLGAALVLAITLLSATMRLTKSGIGCMPWPQCYGAQVGGAAARAPAAVPAATDPLAPVRTAHRVLAVATLLLVVALLALALAGRPRWQAGSGEALALLAVTLFLALLGPFSARSTLPAVVLGNLLGGFAMLALCVRLAARRRIDGSRVLRAWLWLFAALVLAQVVLGGLASATESILSCDGLAECQAAAQGQSWAALNPWRTLGSAPGAPVQWLHRWLAWVVVALGLPLAWRLLWRDGWGAGLLLACLLTQLVLGPAMTNAGFPLALVLAHNLLAALTLALAARWL